MTLSRRISLSGARYSAGDFTLRIKENSATLTRGRYLSRGPSQTARIRRIIYVTICAASSPAPQAENFAAPPAAPLAFDYRPASARASTLPRQQDNRDTHQRLRRAAGRDSF